jgi:tetrahydromethanopterin S-methyltransferase subunit F
VIRSSGDARILVGLKEAAILGVVAGVVFGLFDVLLRATSRRG